jgi:hypothetical protein
MGMDERDIAAIVVLIGSLKQRALLEKTTVEALSETRQNQLRYTRNFALSLSKCFLDSHQRKQLILSTAVPLSHKHTEYSCEAFAISLALVFTGKSEVERYPKSPGISTSKAAAPSIQLTPSR